MRLVGKVSRVLMSLMAVGLLIAPMVGLSYIKSLGHTLTVASVIAATVGGIVAIVTSAKSSEIFTIIAAYGAVMVIFVGTLITGK